VELELLPTAVLCDVAQEPITLLPRVRRLWKGATVAGRALTVWTPPGEHLSVRYALEQAREGDVIVVDCKGSLATALWGSRFSRIALERGIAGLVVDGAVRDLDEMEELGFPVFGVGVVPMKPGREVAGEIGVPIECAGRTIATGDAIYGDGDGVVAVPRRIHDEVVAKARLALEQELVEIAAESGRRRPPLT
jgi:4-hydroxy-4-methyl-2-oxoglutarate aldolase